MKTLRRVTIKPVYVRYMILHINMKQNEIYISEEFGSTSHKCLCGCGELIVLPINTIINGKDLGWKLIKKDDGKVSFTPSVGNYQIPCKSHYIINNNVANFI